jgi:voltage-gated potassium channel
LEAYRASPEGVTGTVTLIDLPKADRRRILRQAVVRALLTVTALVTLYYVLPFDRLSGPGAVLLLLAGLVGLAVVLFWEVRSILRAPYPGTKAVEALATIIPFFLLLFAALYYLLDRSITDSFSQHLSRTDALYFTVTTFSTVGYGDITATSEGARIAVMFQMVSDLIIIGFGIRALMSAVQMGRQLRQSGELRQDGPSSSGLLTPPALHDHDTGRR